ncbi:hypothetical protein SEHO0A_03207 [Salmonella enterica subsp. houtenae str. ATCC BAA-1581]|nr:hypothetical protein SEHO0A_03207 [Salmonella enterica subsp. houtenae str. ATCC BAA-1581]
MPIADNMNIIFIKAPPQRMLLIWEYMKRGEKSRNECGRKEKVLHIQ